MYKICLYKKRSSGFSLIEMSVAIVIVGIIVAGIVSGKNIANSAKLNKFISELSSIQLSYNSFVEQFKQPPGDMRNAHDYWGASCDATPIKCNGNGDSLISWHWHSNGGTNDTDDNETFRAWQHMYLAGFINKPFNGISVGGTDNADENTLYFSSTDKGKYFLVNRQPYNGIFGQQQMANILLLGSREPGKNIWWKTLSVAEAYKIDLKLDDGVANKGHVFGATGYGTPTDSCSEEFLHASGSDYNTANFSSDEKHCVLLFAF
ncbi:MAG: hypothetical protein COV35_01840 [Alphaproteobacteria bacterium CG11_big_fil_rev_8_21_14_0_20_39_49]|nr:MAG: hypothetical protein COV35_01840 [Alphaproteobacteria bacterium CG11_big_fil_rev_8_21_14_0_20_39_49]